MALLNGGGGEGGVAVGVEMVTTGSIYQLVCKYLNILTIEEVLTGSVSALITTLISLCCSILLTTRL